MYERSEHIEPIPNPATRAEETLNEVVTLLNSLLAPVTVEVGFEDRRRADRRQQ